MIPAVGDGPYDGGWLDPLMPAVYPPLQARRTASPAPGCPPFKSKDSVIKRPDDDPAKPDTVAPGLHRFSPLAGPHPRSLALGGAADAALPSGASRGPQALSSGAYSVVWWDPQALALDAKSTLGLRRDDLIVKTGDLFGADERLATYERWRRERDRVVEEASRPSVRVQTATSWAAEAARDGLDEALAASTKGGPAVELVELPGAAGRPRGRVFGALVHAVLAIVPLDAPADIIRRAAEMQQRILLASKEETEAAIVVVLAVLSHDVMSRARASASVRRECPVTWLQPDGVLIEGVLDLAFGRPAHRRRRFPRPTTNCRRGDRYRAQVQQSTPSRATSKPATGDLVQSVIPVDHTDSCNAP